MRGSSRNGDSAQESFAGYKHELWKGGLETVEGPAAVRGAAYLAEATDTSAYEGSRLVGEAKRWELKEIKRSQVVMQWKRDV
jgi:hypothetical protein